MKKLYLKTLATALLLSLNTLGASADETTITETLTFTGDESCFTTIDGFTKGSTDLNGKELSYNYCKINFKRSTTTTDATIIISHRDAINNGIYAIYYNNKQDYADREIKITPITGYKIRSVTVKHAHDGNDPKLSLNGVEDNSTTTKSLSHASNTNVLEETLSYNGSSIGFDYITLTSGNNPYFYIYSFTVNLVPVLDESATEMPSLPDGTVTTDVYLTRSLSASHWNTFCVPFDATAEQIADALGEGCKLKSFGTVTCLYNDDGSIASRYISLVNETKITAGTPYIIFVPADVTNPVFKGVTLSNTESKTVSCSDDVSVQGIYVKTNKSDMTSNGTILYFTTLYFSDGYSYYDTFKKLADNGSIKGTRVYAVVTSDSNAKLGLDFGDGDVTAIDAIDNGSAADDAPAYNMAGQRVSKAYKGIVIVNGKKVVRK